MADIVFQPTFVHKEFVDGPDGDRVRADEPNGFNARFDAIESDLRQLSTVVGQIDAAVDERGTGPVGHVLTLAPILQAVGLAWRITPSGAAQAVDATRTSNSLMEVDLPDNVQLVSFRAMGQGGTGPVSAATVTLSRVAIPGGTAQALATIIGDTDPFDETASIDPALATTATAAFRYIIQATAPHTAGPVTIAAFQIAYTTS